MASMPIKEKNITIDEVGYLNKTFTMSINVKLLGCEAAGAPVTKE